MFRGCLSLCAHSCWHRDKQHRNIMYLHLQFGTSIYSIGYFIFICIKMTPFALKATAGRCPRTSSPASLKLNCFRFIFTFVFYISTLDTRCHYCFMTPSPRLISQIICKKEKKVIQYFHSFNKQNNTKHIFLHGLETDVYEERG